jgi:hypothetical protein
MMAGGQSGRYDGVGVGDAVGVGVGVGVGVFVGLVVGGGVGVGVAGLADGGGDTDPEGRAVGVGLTVGCTGTEELVAVPPEPLQPATATRTTMTYDGKRIAGTSDGRRKGT